MKTNYCLLLLVLLLLGPPLALAQGAPPSVDIANPASFATKDACLAQCEQVFSDCKRQCENSRATARARHFDTPDLPVGECVADCEEDLGLCKEDC